MTLSYRLTGDLRPVTMTLPLYSFRRTVPAKCGKQVGQRGVPGQDRMQDQGVSARGYL